MKIYTKTGDSGTTGLYGGDRVEKTSARIQAIGDVDELNASVGVARACAASSSGFVQWDGDLSRIQCRLFDLGSQLASPPGGKFSGERISEAHVEWLEQSIDAMTGKLEPLRSFILPGGGELAGRLHFARTVCRRSERSVLQLALVSPVAEPAKMFLNRLSDWLFVAARTANAQDGVQDIAWRASEDV